MAVFLQKRWIRDAVLTLQPHGIGATAARLPIPVNGQILKVRRHLGSWLSPATLTATCGSSVCAVPVQVETHLTETEPYVIVCLSDKVHFVRAMVTKAALDEFAKYAARYCRRRI